MAKPTLEKRTATAGIRKGPTAVFLLGHVFIIRRLGFFRVIYRGREYCHSYDPLSLAFPLIVSLLLFLLVLLVVPFDVHILTGCPVLLSSLLLCFGDSVSPFP